MLNNWIYPFIPKSLFENMSAQFSGLDVCDNHKLFNKEIFLEIVWLL